MKIRKTFLLLRLTWIEARIRRLNNKKYSLSCKLNADLSNIKEEDSQRLISELEQLKNMFSIFGSGVDTDE